jgi:hypothetical protein
MVNNKNMVTRAIRAGAAALAVAAVFAAATACGESKFTYVKNSGEQTYFRVPHEWHRIDESTLESLLIQEPDESLTAEIKRQLSWSVAYDAAADSSVTHLVTGGTTSQPIVYAEILQLTAQQQGAISLDLLRNYFYPVTQDAREAAAAAAAVGGREPPFFELVSDEVLTPSKNIHGVRTVYNYELSGGVLHTFDLTALVNNATNHLYVLLIRCSTRCYRDRADELNKIATSFTVRNRS